MNSVLRRSFGLDKLRPGQSKAIDALMAQRDLLCVLPTGSGKSLCYQLPAMLREGMVLVISPLIALMHDQVSHLRALGLPAICLDSQQTPAQYSERLHAIAKGAYRLVYVSPERLAAQDFCRAVQACPPWLVAVDEAHCVVQWGDSFRPAYQHIADWLAVLPQRPTVCAMTATADRAMQRALSVRLRLQHPVRIVMPIRRENLRYQAMLCASPRAWVIRYAQRRPGERGVIFCRSRLETERLAADLRRAGVSAAHYHAGMQPSERQAAQQAFQHGAVQVLAATSAFGMGVDIPDIRYVIQTYLPDTLTTYTQQSGRAGRDGLPADCIQLIVPSELEWMRHQLLRPHSPMKYLRGLPKRLRLLHDTHQVLAHFLRSRCLSASLGRAFGQLERRCGTCSVCLARQRKQRVLRLHVPPLHRMSKNELAVWCGSVVRANLAAERHVSPRSILTDRQLFDAFTSDGSQLEQLDHEALTRMRCVWSSLRHKPIGA